MISELWWLWPLIANRATRIWSRQVICLLFGFVCPWGKQWWGRGQSLESLDDDTSTHFSEGLLKVAMTPAIQQSNGEQVLRQAGWSCRSTGQLVFARAGCINTSGWNIRGAERVCFVHSSKSILLDPPSYWWASPPILPSPHFSSSLMKTLEKSHNQLIQEE